MTTLVSTNEPKTTRAMTLVSSMGMLLFAFVAVAVHALFAGTDVVRFTAHESTSLLNTFVFAAVGCLFLLLTLLAHVPVKRAFSRTATAKVGEHVGSLTAKPVHPLGTLLIPMTIRFIGTFAILVGLISSGSVSRYEAGFDVLFWYVSLTTMEVVGIVWASRSMTTTGSTNFSTATKGV